MANSAGKFGPYPVPSRAAAGRGTVTTRLPVRPQTGAELIRSRIALQVRLAELSPGDRLPDAGVIADQHGMSEMTVRRALETMCQDGLLDRRRGRVGGTFVAADWAAVAAACRDEAQADALADFHLLLECGLVARSADELQPGWDVDLRGAVDEMAVSDDPGELLRLEAHFHLRLSEVLGEGVAAGQVADILGQLSLLAPEPSAAELRDRNRCHADLLSALTLGRLDTAVAAVKAHHRLGRPGLV